MAGASSFFILLLCVLISSSAVTAKIQRVGGPAGWVVHGKDTKYPTWSTKIYHAGHDTLLFLYKKNTDSVLQVTQADYIKCNTKHPIARYNSGADAIKLTTVGDFYFISGTPNHCRLGQKMHAKVTQSGH
nr:chloroplast early nodulin-like protein [Lilium davidii var. unicolor]